MNIKDERRWAVIKDTLIVLGVYVVIMLGLFYIGKDITQLSTLTTLMFGLVGVLGIGNWMTKPSKE